MYQFRYILMVAITLLTEWKILQYLKKGNSFYLLHAFLSMKSRLCMRFNNVFLLRFKNLKKKRKEKQPSLPHNSDICIALVQSVIIFKSIQIEVSSHCPFRSVVKWCITSIIVILISNKVISDYIPRRSVGSVANLKTGGHWFDPRPGQYSFRGLMIVIATGFIPLSPPSVVSTMVMWESSQWTAKNIVQNTG